jgi:hypothetical protein
MRKYTFQKGDEKNCEIFLFISLKLHTPPLGRLEQRDFLFSIIGALLIKKV